MKKILTTLTLLVSVISLSAQGGKDIKNASFREVRTPAKVDSQIITLEGTLNFKMDDYLSMEYGNGELFLIDGNRMTIRRDNQNNTFDLSKNIMMRSLSHVLLYSFQGRLDDLAVEQKCDIRKEDRDGRHIVTLTARKKGVKGYGVIEVSYDAKTKSIRTMRMDEFTGASTWYEMITR